MNQDEINQAEWNNPENWTLLCYCSPRDSRMMDMNVARIAGRLECHRYGFFMSPLFPGIERRPAFEHSGVQVWSLDI